MHFSIPDTRVNKDDSGSSYVSYNIYVNGSFHCSLRYRQLYQFNLQLKKTYGANSLCAFPPKKFFPLTSAQIEERRSQIEKYIQIASQDSQIASSDIFNDFLLSAQREAYHGSVRNGEHSLEIYQLNWQCVRLAAECGENSQATLRRYAKAIHLDERYLPYFCLYLVRRMGNDFQTIRRLQNFESPFITLCVENQRSVASSTTTISSSSSSSSSSCDANHLILIRKSYWDNEYDEDLYRNNTTLNIIYWQALHEIEKGYVPASRETRNRLTTLQAMGDKIEYLKIARTLKYYSYIHFEPCYCDHPMPKSYVQIAAGNQELNMRLIGSNEEYSFRVIRIKCWRLTTSNSLASSETPTDSTTSSVVDYEPTIHKGRFELSFEYLLSKGSLKWITIFSSQAVMISNCLQSMVEEMLVKREGKKFRSEGISLHYNTNPSHSNIIGLSTSDTNEVNGLIGGNRDWNCARKDHSKMISSNHKENQSEVVNPDDVLKQTNGSKSKQIEFSSSDKSHLMVKYSPLMKNNVFDEIGDDDL